MMPQLPLSTHNNNDVPGNAAAPDRDEDLLRHARKISPQEGRDGMVQRDQHGARRDRLYITESSTGSVLVADIGGLNS
jgi:hypothetical protein